VRARLTLIALVALPLLALGGLGAWYAGGGPTARAALPADQSGPPPEFRCENCPGSLEGGEWVKVRDYLQWSGCETWECWSEWNSQGPNALMERPGDSFVRVSGQDNPPGWPNPGHRGEAVPCSNCSIWDGRDACDTDGDGDVEPAAGTWYHNAFAVPSWGYFYDGPDLVLLCSWHVDLSTTYWNFAEKDQCKHQTCVEPTPPVTVTACTWEETPLVEPTVPPPQPTPFVPVEPDVEAMAYVHSHLDRKDGAYPTAPQFYWNWQEFMDASLTANVTEPSVPGCAVSSEVVSYWFYGSVGQTVCPEDSGGPDCRWRPVYAGGAHPDVTKAEWIHLLWSRSATPPSKPASWNFYPVGPVWVDIQYSALVMTTYTCGANTYTAFWPKNLSLRVGLLRTVRTTR
jgi:hypothetical protein